MSAVAVVQEFVNRISRADTLGELRSLIDSAAREIGLRHWCLVSHVDLQTQPGVAISNYPIGWVEQIRARRCYVDDPVWHAADRRVASFKWADIGGIVPVGTRQKMIFEEARKVGLENGFTTPIHWPGGPSASVSVAPPPGGELPDHILPALHEFAAHGYEAARRLTLELDQPRKRVQLTDRQIDAVTLVGRGKTDWEIAQILGVSKATAHGHVEEAKARYGVSSRTQLVTHSLFDGHISFRDIMDVHPREQ